MQRSRDPAGDVHNLHCIALVLSGERVIVRDGGGIGPPTRFGTQPPVD